MDNQQESATQASFPIHWRASDDIPSRKTSTIDGPLADGYVLTRPLQIIVEEEDGEILVSETQFHMHASASTEPEAIAAFRRILAGYLDILGEQEDTLGEKMRKQLEYLRTMIKRV